MLTVNLWDLEFSHSIGEQGFDASSFRVPPKKIQYVRDQMEWDGITLFTNRCLEKVRQVKTTVKIAWMLEARVILPDTYKKLDELENEFDYVITYYEDLLKRDPKKYLPYIPGCCRIPVPDQKIYPKTKLVSHLVSRQMSSEAHRFRHFLAQYLSSGNFPVTIFGPQHTPYPTKLDAHRDFMFSIVITNSRENFYFTEWLIDCLMCGTVPIFYGCPEIHHFFNPDGIIQMNSFQDVLEILTTLTPELYESKLPAIRENFERAKAYHCPDDMVATILQGLPIQKRS